MELTFKQILLIIRALDDKRSKLADVSVPRYTNPTTTTFVTPQLEEWQKHETKQEEPVQKTKQELEREDYDRLLDKFDKWLNESFKANLSLPMEGAKDGSGTNPTD